MGLIVVVLGLGKRAVRGAGGEIQLADAIDHLAKQGKVSAILNAATRYDCGDKFGYLTAIVDVALANTVYGAQFLALFRNRLAEQDTSDLAG